MALQTKCRSEEDKTACSIIPTWEFLFECKEAEVEIRDSTDLTVRRRLVKEGATSGSVTAESWSGNNKGKLGRVAAKMEGEDRGRHTHTHIHPHTCTHSPRNV